MSSQVANSKPSSLALSWLSFVTLAIMILSYKLAYHELWKDEWQAWFVARDMNFWQTMTFLHYEGHPALWYLYLKPYTLFSSVIQNDVLIQIAHFIPVVGVIYLLMIKIKMPLVLKFMLFLSYFVCFEYSIVNRGYILVIFFSLLSTYAMTEKKTGLIALSLFLLCNTEVYGCFIAMSLTLHYFIHQSKNTFQIRAWISAHKLILASITLGLILFTISVFPRGLADDFSRAYIGSSFSTTKIADAFQNMLGNVFFIGLIPDTSTNGFSALGITLSLLAVILLLIIFQKNLAALASIIAMSMILWIFGSKVYDGGVRQYGNYFIFFMCITALSYQVIAEKPWKIYILAFLLIMPMIHNIRGMIKDYQLPFTNALSAGHYIKATIDHTIPIVAINKFEMAPVIGYADRPFYELPEGVPFTWFRWLEKVYLPPESELTLFAKFKKSNQLYLISPEPLDLMRYPNFSLLKSFDQPSFKPESYFLYLMRK